MKLDLNIFVERPCMWCGGPDFKSKKCSSNKYINCCSMECFSWYIYTNFPYYEKPKFNAPLKFMAL